MDAATREGKYLVAKVEKAIGFCQFLAKLQLPDGKIRDVTVLVRGKNKGGRHCATRVDVGCFVIVEDSDPTKLMEIVGVANKQSDLERLRRAGRVSDRLAGEEHELDDLFELAEDEQDDEAKKSEKERAEKEMSRAEELVARYRLRAEMGIKTRADIDLEKGLISAPDAEEVADDNEDEFAAAAGGATKRQRRKKTAALATSPEEEKAMAELAAARAALYAAQERDLVALQAFEKRKVPARWDDDEIDIDAI